MLQALSTASRYKVKSVSVPAPFGGLNSRNSVDLMQPTDAITMSCTMGILAVTMEPVLGKPAAFASLNRLNVSALLPGQIVQAMDAIGMRKYRSAVITNCITDVRGPNAAFAVVVMRAKKSGEVSVTPRL